MKNDNDTDGTIRVNLADLGKVMSQNEHLLKQVTELQQNLTLKEEQLRVHRAGVLRFASSAQAKEMELRLEAVTKEILAKYNINQNSK